MDWEECSAKREERQHPLPPSDAGVDGRSPFQRDRDRILFSSAFRRLAHITQVVAPTEGLVFHNRLTHTLQVAQVGRRLAEKLLHDTELEIIRSIGGINPDVVEAACLAHDLGHPPFGHIAEEALCERVDTTSAGSLDGYEGNAQSFRIVTKLEVRSHGFDGLDLTRATLDALLKYPWLRDPYDPSGKKKRKWGAYRSESANFNLVREGMAHATEDRTVEASIMDWADDVAYSVHDLEDFFRAGLIPLDRLVKVVQERERFILGSLRRREQAGLHTPYTQQELSEIFDSVVGSFPLSDPYHGAKYQRTALRSWSASLIDRYIRAARIQESHGTTSPLQIDGRAEREVFLLKELTWHYVIGNPVLATQQFGQRQVIHNLFRTFMEAASAKHDWKIFPPSNREQLEAIQPGVADEEQQRRRVVVDLIASMTEQQALVVHQRLSGISLGSVLERMNG